jgi:hypothetical protein
MPAAYDILILGASYGSLLACKILFGGHRVTLVCRSATADLLNAEGFRVRLPIKGGQGQVEIDSRKLPGKVSASAPAGVDPTDYDLVCLAMQEPQYRSAGVRELVEAVAQSNLPCVSIMNMPPLTYLKRIRGLNTEILESAYTDRNVWRGFDPALMTMCSADPQAIRPPEEKSNVLQVTLATNFKVARFETDKHTAMLRQLQEEVEAIRLDTSQGRIELPVKLKVHDSVFVPLAKWAMLLTGNYRCITRKGAIAIKEAVHSDLETSRSVYNFVRDLCTRLGASSEDLVPFEKYAAAAESLTRPSSIARSLFAGAPYVERVDRLVQSIAAQHGVHHPAIDATVALVDEVLSKNRQAAA